MATHYKDWRVISRRKVGGGRADWLPTTRPGIVSRTADGAYGEHLKTSGVRSRAVLAGENFEVWARRISAQDTPYWRSWYLQDKQSRGLMTPEEQTNYLKEQGWSNRAYGEQLKTRIPHPEITPHPELYGIPLAPGYGQVVPSGGATYTPGAVPPTARYPQGFTGRVNYMDWLSNYPRLPQSTIPTPTVEYPAPGRPPGPSKPGYTNPLAWRRKNNGWW